MIKEIVSAALASFGLQLTRTHSTVPIEFGSADVRLLNDVITNELTMVSSQRLWNTFLACRYVVEQQILGDFVECGVWRGGNAILAAQVFRSSQARRGIWLFDTFAGMTEPTAADFKIRTGKKALPQFLKSRRGAISQWCFASLDDVKAQFAVRGLLSPEIRFVEGDVMSTLSDPSNLPEQIAVLRLDTDWYESTKQELEMLYPRLSSGGVLIIDDYGSWSGCRLAVDEYFSTLEQRPFMQIIDLAGRCAIKP